MKLSELKQHLHETDGVHFRLPNGEQVPEHFHVTEIGLITKNFIDCGGTIRKEMIANFQLWNASDVEHRLRPHKLLNIIALSEKALGIEDLEIEVEYQRDTIGKYGLDFNGKEFLLTAKHTACLASDHCGVPLEKQKVALSELKSTTCCTPGGGCC